MSRRVVVDGAPALNPAAMVSTSSAITIDKTADFASRAGEKLAGALDRFSIPVLDRRCLDAGAGSGGFTDCLLKGGAREVVAVDVGYGQFDYGLRNDPRVRLLERTNIRLVDDALVDPPFDVIVTDLSFISTGLLIARFVGWLAPSGDIVLLVKPQFEAQASDVPVGGVVTDPRVWSSALESVCESALSVGVRVGGVLPASPRGADGNQEFFVWGRRGEPMDHVRAIQDALESVR